MLPLHISSFYPVIALIKINGIKSKIFGCLRKKSTVFNSHLHAVKYSLVCIVHKVVIINGYTAKKTQALC